MSLPNFLIIGANKAGTTSLHSYLFSHPEIFMSKIKEPMFFAFDGKELPVNSSGIINNINDYKKLFEDVTNEIAIGEASTTYLHNSRFAERIKSYIPNVNIIGILRNPIDRAYSNYRMNVDFGIEKRSFKKCVIEEMKIGSKLNSIVQGKHYLHLGLYSKHVKKYINTFPEKQVNFFLYEHYKENPVDLISQIHDILGVNKDIVPDMSLKHNVSCKQDYIKIKRSCFKTSKHLYKLFGKKNITKSQLTPQLSETMNKFYRKDINDLMDLLNIDLSNWLNY